MDLAIEAKAAHLSPLPHLTPARPTLTEKLLLYSGSIHMAGSVRRAKTSRHAVSGLMQMEQGGTPSRLSVLQFEHRALRSTSRHTGHADFRKTPTKP